MHTAVRAFSVVVMPALAMLTLCCSITSWMACGGVSRHNKQQGSRGKIVTKSHTDTTAHPSAANTTHRAIALLHLVELVYAAYATVGKDESSPFQHQLLRSETMHENACRWTKRKAGQRLLLRWQRSDLHLS
jgi:hypothetical protein